MMQDLSDLSTEGLQRAFKLLADFTRVRVLALLETQELAVQELMDILGMAQSRVSGHLKVLREAGLVTDRRQGTWVFYRCTPPEHGALAESWKLVRQSLESDPRIQRDRELLAPIVQQRAVRARRFFEAVGPEWDALRRIFNDDALRARAINRLLAPGGTVVEIGTGTGVLALELARLGLHVIAVDHSARMLDVARAKAAASGLPGIELHEADAAALPLKDEVVDAAFAHMVLAYLPRPQAAIAEMARVCRPGGTVVVIDFVRHDFDWIHKELGALWLGFSAVEVQGWFEEARLTDVRIAPYEPSTRSPRLPAPFIASGRKKGTAP